MADDRHLAAATLAAAVFAKSTVGPEQDAIKEIVSLYRKIRRRLDTANASLDEQDRLKPDSPKS